MKKIRFKFTIVSIIIFLAPHPDFAQKEWTLKKHKNGIKVYTKSIEDKNINYYKLVATFSGSFDDVIQMVTDFSNYQYWVKDCESSEILETQGNDLVIYYSKFDTPWPASDRDFVNEVQIKRNGDKEVNLIINPSAYSYPEMEGVVRVVNYKDQWKITGKENGLIMMELEGYYDPGGSIPKWIVNLFMIDAPYESVLRIKESVMKE